MTTCSSGSMTCSPDTSLPRSTTPGRKADVSDVVAAGSSGSPAGPRPCCATGRITPGHEHRAVLRPAAGGAHADQPGHVGGAAVMLWLLAVGVDQPAVWPAS